jgi:large subunit ribosomal protein L21
MSEEKIVTKKAPKAVVSEAKSNVFAVIKTGGKQYLVYPGKWYEFEKLEVEEGKDIIFDEVLLVSDGKTTKIGEPFVAGAKVTGKVLAQVKDDKVIVFKYKAKKRVRTTQGHRQKKTKVEITKIA